MGNGSFEKNFFIPDLVRSYLTGSYLFRRSQSLILLSIALLASAGCVNPLSERSRVDQGFRAGVKWDSSQSKVDFDAEEAVSSTPIKVTFTPLDQAGEIYTDPLNVAFGVSGGSGSGQFGPVVLNPDGTYTVEFTPLKAGSIDKVFAIVDGVQVDSLKPTIQVKVGEPSLENSELILSASQVKAGSELNAVFKITDKAGNVIGKGGDTVQFALSSTTGSKGDFGNSVDNGDGSYTAIFTGKKAGVAVPVSVSVNGKSFTFKNKTIQVVSGDTSPAHVFVTVAANTIQAENSTKIILYDQDAHGNQRLTGGNVVSFSTSGGTSTGTIGPVQDHKDGTYSATFTGVQAGTPTTILATVNGVPLPLSDKSPTIKVLPGATSLSASVITVTAPTVQAGNSIGATLTLFDHLGNRIPSGGAKVTFHLADGTSTGNFGTVTDSQNGSYSAQFSAVTAGTPSKVYAKVDGKSIPLTTSTLPSITVLPGPASPTHSKITVSTDTVPAGTQSVVTLQTKDAFGNTLSTGGLNIQFFLNQGSGASEGDFSSPQDLSNGSYVSQFTGRIAGNKTNVGALMGGVPVGGTVPTLKVVPGAPSLAESLLTVSTHQIPSGKMLTAKLVTKDAYGNLLNSGGLNISFGLGSGSSSGVFGQVADLGNGTYTSVFTGLSAGSDTPVQAFISNALVTGSSPMIQVLPPLYSLQTSQVSVSSGTVPAGSKITASLLLKDPNGNPVSEPGLDISFHIAGGTSGGDFGPVQDLGNGQYSAEFTGKVSGTPVSVSAKIAKTTVFAQSPQLTVLPGPLSLAKSLTTIQEGTLAVPAATTVQFTAMDNLGNQLNTGGYQIQFSLTGGTSAGDFGAVVDQQNGTYTATFTSKISGTASQILTQVNGVAATSPKPSVTVVPGAPSPQNSFVTASSTTVASGSNITLTLVTQDIRGNFIQTGGKTVLFQIVSGTSTGTFSPTQDGSNGSYTSTFQGIGVGTPITISATIDGVPLTSEGPVITVIPGAVHLGQSQVTVSSSTVASSSTVTVTLTAKDANGNLLGKGGESIAFGYQGGTSTGTLSSVTNSNTGLYTATFTGIKAGTATTLTATVNGNPVTSVMPTITVTPGPVSLSNSVLATSKSILNSGSDATVTLTTKDAHGNALTTGGLAIAFSHSGGSSTGIFSNAQDHGDGTYTASFTGQAAGTPTSIGATLDGASVTSALPTISVIPGPVSLVKSFVTVETENLISGSPDKLTLIARDAYGNQLTAGGLTVAFSHSDGTSTGTISTTTDQNNGTYSAVFTGAIAGTPTTIHASINGDALLSSTPFPTITVHPGAISLIKSVITVESAVLASGSTETLTLFAKDGSGNPLTSGGLSVVFSHSGGSSTGTVSATTDHRNGTYSATFTGIQAGTATTIAATIGGVPVVNTTPSPTITVIPGPVSLALSEVSVETAILPSGQSETVTVTTRDANGNPLSTGGLNISLSHSGGTSTGIFSSVTDHENGTYSASFTGQAAGTPILIQASINSNPVSHSSPTIQVIPGQVSLANSNLSIDSSTVVSGTTAALTLVTKDAHGNLLTTGGLAVQFSHSGGSSTGTLDSVVDHQNGTYSAVFTGITAGTATTLLAKIGGNPITSSLPTVVVVPGAVSLARSIITTSASSVASGKQITLTLIAKDSNSNPLPTGGLPVLFSHLGGTSTGVISASIDHGNGTYTAGFTGLLAGTPTTIRATINDVAVSSTAPTVTVHAGIVSLSKSTVSVSAPIVASGSDVFLTVTTRDTNGNQLSTGGLSVLFEQASGTSTGTLGNFSDLGNGTYIASFQGVLAGTPRTITARIDGDLIQSSFPTVTVIPGPVSLLHSTLAVSRSSLPNGETSNLTLTTRDSNGNLLTQGGLAISFETLGGTTAGTISSAQDLNNGVYTAVFTATTAGTATQILAKIGGSPIQSTLPTITVYGYGIEVPIEMLDVNLAVDESDSSVPIELSRTRLIPENYNGNPVYSFEVVAESRRAHSADINLIDSAGNVKATITVPAGVNATRFRVPFTPNSTADQYRLKAVLNNQLNDDDFDNNSCDDDRDDDWDDDRRHYDWKHQNPISIFTARIIVKQTGATKTQLYFPMSGSNYYNTGKYKYGNDRISYIDLSHSNYQGNWHGRQPNRFNLWKKNSSAYSGISSTGTPWSIDAIIWSNNSGKTCSIGLFNSTTGASTPVTGTELSTNSITPAYVSNSFSDSTSGFTNQNDFEVKYKTSSYSGHQCFVGKAGIWLTLNDLTKGEIFYRIQKPFAGHNFSYVNPNERILLDTTIFNSPNLTLYFETSGVASSGSNAVISPASVGTTDVGTSGAIAVPGCSIAASSLGSGTSRKRVRSSACTSWTSGHRMVQKTTISTGHISTASQFLVIQFE